MTSRYETLRRAELATLLLDAAAVICAAIFFGIIAAMVLGLVAGFSQSLGKLSLDALIARSRGTLRRLLEQALERPPLLERLRERMRLQRRPDAARDIVGAVLERTRRS